VLFSAVKQDNGYNSLAIRAIEAMERDHGVHVRQRVAAEEREVQESIDAFAARGVGNIVLLGSTYAEQARRAAARHPRVRFTLLDAAVEAPNVRSVVFREEEGAYLAGLAAALTGRGGTVGFLGGMPIPPIHRFGCGFIQGVLAGAPKARVAVRYASADLDGFRDTAKAARAASELLEEGAGVVFVASGLAGIAALETVAAAGRLSVGVDTNQNGTHPGRVLTSVIKRVDVALRRTVEDGLAGQWRPGVLHLGLADGAIDWARDEHNEALVAPLAARVEEARRRIAIGRIRVGAPEDTPACAVLTPKS